MRTLSGTAKAAQHVGGSTFSGTGDKETPFHLDQPTGLDPIVETVRLLKILEGTGRPFYIEVAGRILKINQHDSPPREDWPRWVTSLGA